MSADTPFVTVIVPCRNEERHIGGCLESIARTKHPAERLEVLIVDGESTDRTREVVSQYAGHMPYVRLLANPRRITPAAMNVGIRAAAGDVIVRMDAHASYPPGYIPALLQAMRERNADNVGGRMITVPGGPGPVAKAIACALAHPFGVGNSRFRIGSTTERWVDTVQFGCYRREVFTRIGLFDEELVRNQDDEFNYRLTRHGGRILLTPRVELRYFGRTSLRQLWRMFFQYGRFKPLVARKVGRIMTGRQLVPALFVLALIALAATAPLVPAARGALTALLASYLVLALGSALAALRRLGPAALVLPLAFTAMHIGYGTGFLLGLWHLVRGRRPRLQAAAVPLSR